MNSFDVIIPVSLKDTFFLSRTIDYILKNIVGVSSIYIITSSKNINRINKIEKNYKQCKIIDENRLINELNYNYVDDKLKNRGAVASTGWLFQQFIKMGFARSKYCKKYYLSWDADTIPLNPIHFFLKGHPIFTVKKEFHEPYFYVIKDLLGLNKRHEYSFIAEHMLFNAEIMREMIDEIECRNTNGNNWIDKIINTCNPLQPNCFSEFETYGTFCSQYYPNLYQTQKLNTLRAGSIIRGPFVNNRLLNILSFDLDIVSFEIWMKPDFPWNIAYYMLKIYIKILEKKQKCF